MEEFGPISTLPLGLPNLFGQTGQQLPKAFQSVIQPQLDVMPFVAAANCLEQLVLFPANLVAVGQTDLFTVPDGEAWLVRGAYYTVGVLGATTQSLKGRIYVGRRTTGSAYTDVHQSWDVCDCVNNSNTDRVLLASSQGWFLAYPGDRIGFNAETFINGPFAGRAVAQIWRFTV